VSESGSRKREQRVSAVEALWALGARQSLKKG
jgi:hypothetical protein